MLEQIEQRITEKSEVESKLNELKSELFRLGVSIREKRIPVIITFDGWSASGKGSQISRLIKCLDPRFYKVASIRTPNAQEKRKPWMHRYWKLLPAKGNFLVLDRSWYRDTANAYLYGEITKQEYKRRIEDINTFERQLADDGYIIIKFFLHISKEEQSRRIDKLVSSDITKWRIDDHDLMNNKEYDKFEKHYEKMLAKTNTKSAVWHIVAADNKVTAEHSVLTTVTQVINGYMAARDNGEEYNPVPEFPLYDYKSEIFETLPTVKLSDSDLTKRLEPDVYEKKLKKYQDRLFKLQNLCYKKKIPVIIAYEGWDAGGKGGNIKRVAAALDPRGYEVKPIASPEPSELARHYLWRFWTRLENDGHFTIFDRTWYGRVMVEPIEKITPQQRADMAYREINEFEKQLSDWGAVVIKFWINIDKDEQYRRFKERENTPAKRWKITDEDWRNREKWDEYENAVNKMIELTSTENAPWTVIEGNDKKYARIKALKTICKRLESRLEEK